MVAGDFGFDCFVIYFCSTGLVCFVVLLVVLVVGVVVFTLHWLFAFCTLSGCSL